MTDITISGVDKVLLRNYSFVLHNYLVATRIAQLVFRDGVGWGGVGWGVITLDQAAHLRDATLEMGWGGMGCDNVGSSCALT